MHKYTFDIECNGHSRKLILARASQESEEHLALKLLAYLLYFDRRPKVETGVGQHYKPDLVCDDGRHVTLWIDCGDIGMHKLDRVTTTNHRAEIVVVKASERAARSYIQLAAKRVRRPERIQLVTFDDRFVDALVAVLSTRTELTATWDDASGELKLVVNESAMHTRVRRMPCVPR
jgi:uncharacterized protein YaeQ